MNDPLKPRGGAGGVWLLLCAVAGGAGLAFDLVLNPGRGFWIGEEPGARAAIGAMAALFAVLAGHIARWALARREDKTKGGRDAGVQP